MRSERMDNKAHFHFHTSCTAYHFRYNVETLSYHTMYMLGLCSFRPSRMPGTISGTEREEKRERERERTGAKERVVQFEFAIMPFHLISSGWFGFFCVRIMFSIVIILAGTGQNTHAIYWKLHGGGAMRYRATGCYKAVNVIDSIILDCHRCLLAHGLTIERYKYCTRAVLHSEQTK